MFCPNCAGELQLADTEKLISQDLWGGDYYTHQCLGCKTYWHLHISSGNVTLISTKAQEIASKKIVDDLKIELSERVFRLEK